MSVIGSIWSSAQTKSAPGLPYAGDVDGGAIYSAFESYEAHDITHEFEGFQLKGSLTALARGLSVWPNHSRITGGVPVRPKSFHCSADVINSED